VGSDISSRALRRRNSRPLPLDHRRCSGPRALPVPGMAATSFCRAANRPLHTGMQLDVFMSLRGTLGDQLLAMLLRRSAMRP
jgi:hypothetical protein